MVSVSHNDQTFTDYKAVAHKAALQKPSIFKMYFFSKFEKKKNICKSCQSMSTFLTRLSIIVNLDKLNEQVSTMLVVSIEDEGFAAQG